MVYEWPANCRIFVSRVSLAPDREDADFVGKDVIAEELATGTDPSSAEAIKAALQEATHHKPLDVDVARVRSRLAAGGWPLAPVTGSHG